MNCLEKFALFPYSGNFREFFGNEADETKQANQFISSVGIIPFNPVNLNTPFSVNLQRTFISDLVSDAKHIYKVGPAAEQYFLILNPQEVGWIYLTSDGIPNSETKIPVIIPDKISESHYSNLTRKSSTGVFSLNAAASQFRSSTWNNLYIKPELWTLVNNDSIAAYCGIVRQKRNSFANPSNYNKFRTWQIGMGNTIINLKNSLFKPNSQNNDIPGIGMLINDGFQKNAMIPATSLRWPTGQVSGFQTVRKTAAFVTFVTEYVEKWQSQIPAAIQWSLPFTSFIVDSAAQGVIFEQQIPDPRKQFSFIVIRNPDALNGSGFDINKPLYFTFANTMNSFIDVPHILLGSVVSHCNKYVIFYFDNLKLTSGFIYQLV